MRKQHHSLARELYELLSSMRFAVAMLTVLGVASIIGTVLKQNEPYPNYMVQFGQFWFTLFERLGLYDVYHSVWFIAILAFLVLSTGLCIYRNTPLMLREMRAWRSQVTEVSLRLFAHQAEYHTALPKEELLPRLGHILTTHGFRYRTVEKGNGLLITAKAGVAHRLGYILTHMAIVVICVGGLVDSNLPFKFQELMGWKRVETRDLPADQVPPESRLPVSNLSFRGNLTIPEGSRASIAFLRVRDGYLVQELPFSIALKKFRVEHYATGMPKSFESDVVIFDPEHETPLEATISVNHPLIYRGIAIYQSDFQDGGSSLSFRGWPLTSSMPQPFDLGGKVGETVSVETPAGPLAVELDDFRLFNVLNLSDDGKGKPTNVGPSVTFKVRDTQGQAREYLNYMQPMVLNGRPYLVSGMRSARNEEYRYLRLPLDAEGTIDGFMQWRAMMFDTGKMPVIARNLADKAMQGDAVSETLRSKFEDSVIQLLQLFARGGLTEIAVFIERSVPEREREKAAETYLKILENAAFEAYVLSRQAGGKPVPSGDAETAAFLRDSLNAASDAFFYGTPFYLQLTDFQQRQASGFQLTRAPGKNMVYAGSLLLVLGIFAMFYIRERRVWLLVKSTEGRVLFAMSGTRRNRDLEAEFEHLKHRLQHLME